jgi:D-alanine-D-alanine ligase
MMPRLIVCMIDDDIIKAVARGKSTSREAMYDISVVRALRRLPCSVHLVGAGRDLSRTIEQLTRLRPGLVFNLAFSAHPLEASFAGVLDVLGIPYTGSGPLGIGLTNDKARSRRLLAVAGIAVPRFVELGPARRPKTIGFPPPFIVKPVSLANSLGVHADSVVRSYQHALKRAGRIWRQYRVPALCDEFIVGREFQVGLVETARRHFKVSAIVELNFAGASRGRGFKSEAVEINGKRKRLYEVATPLALLPRGKWEEMAEIARTACRVLELRGYAKVDLRMDSDGRVAVIEANANPGLWSAGNIWRTPNFEANLRFIIDAALSRARE